MTALARGPEEFIPQKPLAKKQQPVPLTPVLRKAEKGGSSQYTLQMRWTQWVGRKRAQLSCRNLFEILKQCNMESVSIRRPVATFRGKLYGKVSNFPNRMHKQQIVFPPIQRNFGMLLLLEGCRNNQTT